MNKNINKLVLIITLMIIFSLSAFSQIDRRKIGQKWKTDRSNHSVSLNEFLTLLPRDRIQPIDNPKFWNKSEGDKVFFKHEPVIAVTINGQSKAYPLSILMFHEIVNDKVGGVPISATYCPLCNASIVFDRRLTVKGNDYLLDFGTTGMLRKSDLVMWDRQTETWWQQFTGEGLVGELNGAQLVFMPSMLISYEEFFKAYPDGVVLSTDTGRGLKYGMNPYINYDRISNKKPPLFKGTPDSRLPAMERVINININGIDRIYPLSIVHKKRVINDLPHGVPVVVFFQAGTVSAVDNKQIKDSKDVGAVTVFSRLLAGQTLEFKAEKRGFRDEQTGSLWTITGKCIKGSLTGKQLEPVVHGNHFAFAWFAFKPKCEIYQE